MQDKLFKLNEYLKETTPSRAIRIIKYIQSADFDNKECCLYARGNIFKSRKEIRSLEKKFPVKVETVESIRKGIWRIVPIPAPNYIVIKINSFDILEKFYNCIYDTSIITFYFFNKKFEHVFLKIMTKERQNSYIGPIYQDSSYFVYGIDTDDQESESGFKEFVSYGVNAPVELINFL